LPTIHARKLLFKPDCGTRAIIWLKVVFPRKMAIKEFRLCSNTIAIIIRFTLIFGVEFAQFFLLYEHAKFLTGDQSYNFYDRKIEH